MCVMTSPSGTQQHAVALCPNLLAGLLKGCCKTDSAEPHPGTPEDGENSLWSAVPAPSHPGGLRPQVLRVCPSVRPSVSLSVDVADKRFTPRSLLSELKSDCQTFLETQIVES